MRSHSCPACGAKVQFKSRFSTHTVCSFCQSFLIREKDILSTQGKMAMLAEDPSPLQIGTQGTINSTPFEVIGLMKAGWEHGFWHEWYVVEETGACGWLAEAMGQFSYCYQTTLITPEENPAVYKINQTISIQNKSYIICDIKNFTCDGCMGELPFGVNQGEEGIAFDLRCEDDSCAYFEYIGYNKRVFMGQYFPFETFHFTDLRELDDW